MHSASAKHGVYLALAACLISTIQIYSADIHHQVHPYMRHGSLDELGSSIVGGLPCGTSQNVSVHYISTFPIMQPTVTQQLNSKPAGTHLCAQIKHSPSALPKVPQRMRQSGPAADDRRVLPGDRGDFGRQQNACSLTSRDAATAPSFSKASQRTNERLKPVALSSRGLMVPTIGPHLVSRRDPLARGNDAMFMVV